MESQLTNAEYWSKIWNSSDLPAPIDDQSPLYRGYADFLKKVLAGRSGSLLEIGCACSGWLPYLAKRGFGVSGIDYSPVGCQQARMMLDRERCGGDIYERDAFADNPDLVGRFDVVLSLGVVEHFSNTAEPIRAFSRYLKPQGMLISTCPNMTGLLGLSQKLLDRAIYELHVPLTAELLRDAHERVGLTVRHCNYIGSLDFHIINVRGGGWRTVAHRVLMRLSRIGWKLPLHLEPGPIWSSAVGCAAYQNTPER